MKNIGFYIGIFLGNVTGQLLIALIIRYLRKS